jgi:tetratricopeptide (TPR) repeat protein
MLMFTVAGRPQKPEYQEPDEEDKSLSTSTEYSFNPLQATKEFNIGQFYWKRGSYRAAAGRFEEAVKWNPGFAAAHYRLGEAREKQAGATAEQVEKQLLLEGAAEAYKKFIELEPDSDKAKALKKKLPKLAGKPA